MNLLIALVVAAGILTPAATVAAPSHEETEIKEEKILTVEESVIDEFGAESKMYYVAQCESHHNQFNVDGSVLRGRVNPQDVGVFQINEFYHLEESKKLGMDIHTTAGNIDYARHLYDTQGLSPWVWSRPCWGVL